LTEQDYKIELLKQALSTVPRVQLCSLPSPIERWENLKKEWNLNFNLYAKRDDLTGVAYGGNKSRQLEFLLADAISQGCDSVVHGGALQSNYCRQLTAAANKYNLKTHLVLSTNYDQRYDTGNHLIMQILGAHLNYFDGPLGYEHEDKKRELQQNLINLGKKPYLITYPTSEILGGLSYVNAALEFAADLKNVGDIGRIVLPAVGAGYAGLLLGLNYLELKDIEVIGIAPLLNEYNIEKTISLSIEKMIQVLNLDFSENLNQKININFDFAGEGYAKVSKKNISVLLELAQSEGVLVDPVYTSKALEAIKSRKFPDKNTLFWHTGGSPAIFSYAAEILEHKS
jgi:1-aminocyclopropane-1-carboxylate deaminase/D-cysteine desulfhydrase-like pyridoxal-dependent ACC family enzyme